MKTYGLKIKDFVKAGKAATGDARAMVSPNVLTDGRMAMTFDKLAAEDAAGLLRPVEVPIMPPYVNCTTEEQAAANNAAIKAAGEAQDAAKAHNVGVCNRLALLTGLKGSTDCRALPAASDKIFIGPAACRAFQFTGLVYAPATGTDSKNKQEICIFEEVEKREPRGSMEQYNLSDPAGRAAYEAEKEKRAKEVIERERAEAARIFDSENEPEGPRVLPNPFEGGHYKEENRAPHALRRIGINRKYVELLGLGGADKVVYMDAEKDLSMVFCDGKPEPGAALSGAVVMPMKGF